jgi:hypothetical protein
MRPVFLPKWPELLGNNRRAEQQWLREYLHAIKVSNPPLRDTEWQVTQYILNTMPMPASNDNKYQGG